MLEWWVAQGQLMHMNKIIWEEGLDMASLVEAGAINRALGTSRSDVSVRGLFPDYFVHMH